jgi:precorrin-3B C17-methyltransferase
VRKLKDKTQNAQDAQNAQSGALIIVGLGPGDHALLAPMALHALQTSDIIIGYRYYIEQIRDLLTEQEVHTSELSQEVERAQLAVDLAWQGSTVCMVSSGDAGIYAMAGLVLDLFAQSVEQMAVTPDISRTEPDIQIIPGISALNAAAALLGAPLMHDFAVISLSDLLTPWDTITRRISAVAAADFVVVIYNPTSRKRNWQLKAAFQLLGEHRSAQTPVGFVRNAYRPEQTVIRTTLEHALEYEVDMFTTVIIGNSQTSLRHNLMITPRGYPTQEPTI